ncbi:helix-turn-helix domain-containing protein [Streptomyces albidoflavus]|uniref:helix-turn-helix domain-containing protein n=1 Tax=Streptomyces albidoflavus TaxID=1886 RepID=UPI0033F61643
MPSQRGANCRPQQREGNRVAVGVPTVRRRRLGGKLRSLRGDLTLEEVAEASEGAFALSKLSRLENARNAAKPADIDRLLDLYAKLGRDVDDELRAALLDLTKAGSQRGWWHSYRGVLTPVYEDLISLEAEASSVCMWQMGTIPGLLQTGDYAREFIRTTAMSDGVQSKVDALVEVRLARQAVLTRERPVDLWAIIAEAALRVRVKDQGVMREQLSRLLALSQRPNVNVQIMPSDTPPHIGQMGSYTLLGFGDHHDLDVVHTETLTSAVYVEDRTQVSAYRDGFGRLQASALSVEASMDRMTEIRDQL